MMRSVFRGLVLLVAGILAVATAEAQTLRTAVTTSQAPPQNCVQPTDVHQFSLQTDRVYVWFLIDGTIAGDTYQARWTAADGVLFTTSTWDVPSGGSRCFWGWITPSESAISASQTGTWRIDVSRNGSPMFSLQFQFLDPSEQRPVFSENGVVDPWNYRRGITAGGWVSIYGEYLATSEESWQPQVNEGLQTELGGTVVRVNGIRSALSYASNGLVNVLVPGTTPQGYVNIVVERDGLTSEPVRVFSRRASPTIYSLPDPTRTDRFYATVAVAGTSELVGSPGIDPRVTRGARTGELIDLYLIGLGRTDGGFPTDRYFTNSYTPLEPLRVFLGPFSITPQFAALIAPGLYVVRFRVPTSILPQDAALSLNTGDINSSLNVYLKVEAAPIPPLITSLSLSSSTVVGGNSVSGQVFISRPAPEGGLTIELRSSNSNVRPPSTVRIEEGLTSGSFTVATDAVGTTQTASITASLGSSQRQATLSVRPAGPASIFEDYDITIEGTTSVNGRQVALSLTVSVPSILPMALVDTTRDFSNISLDTTLYISYGDPSISGNTVTFSGIVAGTWGIQTVTSGKLTVSANSPNVGTRVTGTITLSTLDRNLNTSFEGQLVSSRRVN